MDKALDLELSERYRSGDRKAAAELVARHDGLVRLNAWRLAPMLRSLGYELEDVAQLGREGLLLAAERYDGSHAFTTYAVHWVRACMLKPTQEGMTTARLRLAQVRVARGQATDAEVAAVRQRQALRRPVTSLQAPAAREDVGPCTDTLQDMVPDEQAEPADVALERKEAVARVRREVARLKDGRLRGIVERRFGLLPGREPETLADIGADLGVSRERARQLEAKALGIIRARMEEYA